MKRALFQTEITHKNIFSGGMLSEGHLKILLSSFIFSGFWKTFIVFSASDLIPAGRCSDFDVVHLKKRLVSCSVLHFFLLLLRMQTYFWIQTCSQSGIFSSHRRQNPRSSRPPARRGFQSAASLRRRSVSYGGALCAFQESSL